MQEISITKHGLATMCRLCLSKGLPMFDMFRFSSRFDDQIVDVIMKCAPVQIMRRDGLPKFICGLCCTQLEKIHQFQMQIIQSDKTLRGYLQKLHASNKQAVLECSIQKPSEIYLFDNTNADMKCESLNLHDVFEKECESFNSSSEITDEMSLKSKIKVEQMDENSIIPPDADNEIENISKCGKDSKMVEDLDVNWKMEEPANFNSSCKNIEEIFVKTEPIDESSLILPEYINGDSVISCEDTKNCSSNTSGNFIRVHSTDIGENFEKNEKKNKHTSTNRNGDFKRSEQRRTEEKPYHCGVCNKRFAQSDSLKLHKRIHTGEKLYQCDVCDKRFTQSYSLNIHKLIHTGERPYQCNVCNKRFITFHSLNIHKRTHTGEKPYKCDMCVKCFAQSGTLNKHKLTHTGEKPYRCDICNKSFTASHSLSVHKRTHTGEKQFCCSICSKSFLYKSSLRYHKIIHTGE